MPVCSLLGANHSLPIFHTAIPFIRLNETKQLINEFTIGYMINQGLNVNKAFREQVEKCIYTNFFEITLPFIKVTLAKMNTSLLALIFFNETRSNHPTKYY